jgi:hypothetical protein
MEDGGSLIFGLDHWDMVSPSAIRKNRVLEILAEMAIAIDKLRDLRNELSKLEREPGDGNG